MPIVGVTQRIYKVTLRGLIGIKPTLNEFAYRVGIAQQPSAADVAANFITEIADNILPTQSGFQVYTSVDVIDAMDVSNFASVAYTQAGTRGTDAPSPNWVCWSMRLLRSSRDMYSGWKRFSGLIEADVLGNGFTAAYLELLVAQAADIIQPLNIDLATLPLVVLRDAPTPRDQTVEVNDPTTWKFTDVGSTAVPNRNTTQNSRKFF